MRFFGEGDYINVYRTAIPETATNPKILSVGSGDGQLELELAKTLQLLPARAFYTQFLSPLWIYAMIDISKSRQSMNALKANGRTVYPGLYENQIVEAQMAGAAVVGQKDALYEELVCSQRTGLRFGAHEETDRIVDFAIRTIENRREVFAKARQWAIANHSISNMVEPILDAVS
ncbi:MAG: glycosyltransferase family 4 protein [bacterium]|nr:glycosyltransferase family 4 protein [bacterium]